MTHWHLRNPAWSCQPSCLFHPEPIIDLCLMGPWHGAVLGWSREQDFPAVISLGEVLLLVRMWTFWLAPQWVSFLGSWVASPGSFRSWPYLLDPLCTVGERALLPCSWTLPIYSLAGQTQTLLSLLLPVNVCCTFSAIATVPRLRDKGWSFCCQSSPGG
jgi:hypothetical protein